MEVVTNTNVNSDGNTSVYVGYSLAMQVGYANASVMVVSFPSTVSNLASTTCTAVTNNLISVICTKSSNQIQATLTFVTNPTVGL